MEESTRKLFDKWQGSIEDSEIEDPLDFALAAFEQGFAEGVASMMDRLGMMLIKKTGKIVPKPDTVASVAEKAQQARLVGDIARRNLGRIIKTNKETSDVREDGGETDQDQRRRKRGHVPVRRQAKNA